MTDDHIGAFLASIAHFPQDRQRNLKRSAIARIVGSMRATQGGGRPKIRTECPSCGIVCPSYRQAQIHCRQKKEAA